VDQAHRSAESPNVSSYIALSYCWHYTSWTLTPSLMYDPWDWQLAHLNNGRHPVTSPILSALLSERRDATEPFWISARWFSRAWCSHEFQNGQEHIFLVPVNNSGAWLSHSLNTIPILRFDDAFLLAICQVEACWTRAEAKEYSKIQTYLLREGDGKMDVVLDELASKTAYGKN
jgi:hypothetical protein